MYNNGKIFSYGSSGGAGRDTGGSSGGGSINIFYKESYNSKTSVEANGGVSRRDVSTGAEGGAGGNGTVTIGNIGTFVKNE